jgi:hypothetical protein
MVKKLKEEKVVITPEEKARWKPILQRTWNYIAYDAIQACGGEAKRSDVIEFACDADRPVTDGGMTKEEYRVLSQWYDTRSFKDWIAKEVFTSKSYVI